VVWEVIGHIFFWGWLLWSSPQAVLTLFTRVANPFGGDTWKKTKGKSYTEATYHFNRVDVVADSRRRRFRLWGEKHHGAYNAWVFPPDSM